MKTKGVLKGLLASACVLSVVACSSTGDFDDMDKFGRVSGGSGYAETSGLGESSAFPGANVGKVDPRTGERGNTVYFGFDSTTITPQYKSLIEANARYLKAHPNARVRLEGNTDPRGSREYNIGLGQRRGNQVDDYLQMLGVSPRQMVVVSYGKEKLAVPGHTEEAYRLDRRVEIVYESAG